MAPRGNSFDYTTNRHEIIVYYWRNMHSFKPFGKYLKLLFTVKKLNIYGFSHKTDLHRFAKVPISDLEIYRNTRGRVDFLSP